MKMSVREARAQFAAAIAAAERGERVTITRNGKAVAEIAPPSAETPQEASEDFWVHVDRVRENLGLDKLPPDPRTAEEWLADHKAWRRAEFGPEYFGDTPEPSDQ